MEDCAVSSDRYHNANAYVDPLFELGRNVIRIGAQTEEGGWRSRILGYRVAGAFFDCSEAVSVVNNSKKKWGKKKNMKGYKGN